MLHPGPAKKLIITVNEADRWQGQGVYNALLVLFRHRRLAGATVSRALAGFTGRGTIQRVDQMDGAMPPPSGSTSSTPRGDRPCARGRLRHRREGARGDQDTHIVKLGTGQEAAAPSEKEDLVRLVGKAKMRRIHIGENDKWEGEPLYQTIVKRARQLDIAGATVYKGILGYGAHKRLHKDHALTLSSDDPIMITVIDEEEKIKPSSPRSTRSSPRDVSSRSRT